MRKRWLIRAEYQYFTAWKRKILNFSIQAARMSRFSRACIISAKSNKMPKNRIIIILGVFIALLPVLGFPRLWESFFQVAVGLSIMLLSVWASIDKRLTIKAKAH